MLVFGLEVALRKESVDRNPGRQQAFNAIDTSLSARRAWIEISGSKARPATPAVALRKESVDRNYNATSNPANKLKGRSPQGERG